MQLSVELPHEIGRMGPDQPAREATRMGGVWGSDFRKVCLTNEGWVTAAAMQGQTCQMKLEQGAWSQICPAPQTCCRTGQAPIVNQPTPGRPLTLPSHPCAQNPLRVTPRGVKQPNGSSSYQESMCPTRLTTTSELL